jgi:3-oxoacyl-[acyl-carrier protein] reductase
LNGTEGQVITFKGDVRNRDFARELETYLARKSFGSPEVVVCNAGGPPQKTLLETTNDDWICAIETCLLGQIRVVKQFLPNMVKRRFGRIIFISSTAVKEPTPAMVLSATARMGINALAKSISKEFGNSHITANVVLLGGVLTSRLEKLISDAATKNAQTFESVRANLISSIPAERFANPSEISNLVAFLISDEAAYINGAQIIIDGGLTKGVY